MKVNGPVYVLLVVVYQDERRESNMRSRTSNIWSSSTRDRKAFGVWVVGEKRRYENPDSGRC
jgi:hypothetical protein